ncbi:hypothetical protein F4781DRAFT_151933 [Annulohypoxylon bovei var. microspora]|nr:hypothetical protein F4781DRAFT_151933 [Annulohypoxylon bovei var. microspora]
MVSERAETYLEAWLRDLCSTRLSSSLNCRYYTISLFCLLLLCARPYSGNSAIFSFIPFPFLESTPQLCATTLCRYHELREHLVCTDWYAGAPSPGSLGFYLFPEAKALTISLDVIYKHLFLPFLPHNEGFYFTTTYVCSVRTHLVSYGRNSTVN